MTYPGIAPNPEQVKERADEARRVVDAEAAVLAASRAAKARRLSLIDRIRRALRRT